MHKLAKMVNVTAKRGAAEGCATVSCFGLPGEPATFCTMHKLTTMVDVMSKRSAREGPCLEAKHLHGESSPADTIEAKN
jgi:hypothetical protein